MTERDELRAILSTMLHKVFPDQTTAIIKYYKEMAKEVNEILEKSNIRTETDESIIQTLSDSMVFAALNWKKDPA